MDKSVCFIAVIAFTTILTDPTAETILPVQSRVFPH